MPAFVADVHALCIHLEALSLLRDRERETSAPTVATPWRGHEGGRVTAASVGVGDGNDAFPIIPFTMPWA